MATQATELYLLEDLDQDDRASGLTERDRAALRSVAGWIETYVLQPHEELVGHTGPVCPFLPRSVERRALWLAAEQIADRGVADVIELMSRYKRRLLEAEPADGDGVNYDVIAVVFTDLPADRAKAVFDAVQQELAVPSYVEDGVLFGPYYEGNEVTAINNPSFRPFESPVPFLFVRHGVVGDWKFFLDDDQWLNRWAHRYGETGAQALAEQLRGLPWRVPEPEQRRAT